MDFVDISVRNIFLDHGNNGNKNTGPEKAAIASPIAASTIFGAYPGIINPIPQHVYAKKTVGPGLRIFRCLEVPFIDLAIKLLLSCFSVT